MSLKSRTFGQINSGTFRVFSAELSAPILVCSEFLGHVFHYSTIISTKNLAFISTSQIFIWDWNLNLGRKWHRKDSIVIKIKEIYIYLVKNTFNINLPLGWILPNCGKLVSFHQNIVSEYALELMETIHFPSLTFYKKPIL